MAGKGTKIELVIGGKDNTKKTFADVNRSLAALDQKAAETGRALKSALTAYLSLNTIKSIARIKDEWTDLSGRIKVATGSQSDYEHSVKRLEEISERTFSSMTSNAELFIQSLKPLQEQGFGTSEILDFTEAVNLGLDASGAKGEAAAAVIRQLSQALQVGVLRGQDFNSVLTGAPEIINAVALSLGKSRSELLAMARAGDLTTEVFVPALIEQMDSMGEKADQAEKTVTDAMFTLTNNFNKAIAGADVKPLVDGLTELSDVVKDPATQEGLAQLAGGVARLGGGGLRALSGLGDLGVDIGAFFAQITGGLSATDKLERKIKELDRIIASPWRKASSKYTLFSDDDIKKQRALAQSLLDLENERLTGTSSAMREAAEERKKAIDEEQQKELASRRKHAGDIKRVRDDVVKEAEKQSKALVKNERKALSDIEKLQKDRLSITERYRDALRKLNGPSGDEPATYEQAQDSKLLAQQALARGDSKEAQAAAQDALATLLQIKEEGGNTYGFAGLIKALGDIEIAANQLETDKAQNELDKVRAEMVSLQEQADKLKDFEVSAALDNESLNDVRAQVKSLIEQLKLEAVVPVKLQVSKGEGLPAFATGGRIRGPGTGTSDSILARVSDGEYVMRAAAVRKYGANMMENLNSMRLPQFSTGGMVSAVSDAQPSPQNIGTLNFNLPGGESFSVDVAGTNSMDDLHRAALKFGRTRR